MISAAFGGKAVDNPFKPADPTGGLTPEERQVIKNRKFRDLDRYFTAEADKKRRKRGPQGKNQKPPPPGRVP